MLRFPIVWNHGSGFTLNNHLTSTGVPVANFEGTLHVIVDRALPIPVFRETLDPYHLATGGSLGRAHRGMARIDMSGRIEAPQDSRADAEATVRDLVEDMRASFDPGICLRDSPTTEGAFALDFTERTGDTATYPSGLIPMRYYARPLRQPIIDEDNRYVPARPFDLALIAPDPRAYEQTEQTLTLTVGTPSGAVVNNGNVASALKAIITMAGAGSAGYSLSRGGVAFQMNLSTLIAGDVVTVTFEASGPYGLLIGRTITLTRAGVTTNRFDLKTTGAGSWLDVPVGSTTFAVASATNASTQLRWRSARA